MVIRNNSTRWNLTYLMIQRALLLQSTIRIYTMTCVEKRGVNVDKAMKKLKQLSDQDWEDLADLAKALQPFHQATKRLEGIAKSGYGSLWECLPVMEYLLTDLEAQVPAYDIQTPLQAVVNNAWNKLHTYYNLTDRSPYYIAAMVLQPHYKWNYFQVTWRSKPTWISQAKERVEELWRDHLYKEQAKEQAVFNPPSPLSGLAEQDTERFDPIRDFLLKAKLQNSQQQDEYKSYCALPAPAQETENLFLYWQAQEQAYPKLARLAFTTLAIPAMSAECERVFSSCKQLVTPSRNKLSAQAIEANECLRSWYRQGILE